MLLDRVWEGILACLKENEVPALITLPVQVKHQVTDEARLAWVCNPGVDTLWGIPVAFEQVTIGSVRTESGDTRVVHV